MPIHMPDCVYREKKCFKYTSNENTTEVEWPARYFIVCIYIIIKIFGFLKITKSSMIRPKLFPNLKTKVNKSLWRKKIEGQNWESKMETIVMDKL